MHDACATLDSLTGNETLLILVPTPGDEARVCGGLIAASCRRGRQPFVMVLGDGTSHPDPAAHPPDHLARLHERETRQAVRYLGLNNDRLLMAGLHDGHIPHDGPVFDAVVRAVTLVMWARDCNVICAPCLAGKPDDAATHRIAAHVAATSGVGLLLWASAAPLPPGEAVQFRGLDITPHLAAKRDAINAHSTIPGCAALDDPAPSPANFEAYRLSGVRRASVTGP